MLQRVTVWLNELAPASGGFVGALEWAAAFHIPLNGILLRDPACHSPTPEKLEACLNQCRQRGVSWETSLWDGPIAVAAMKLLRPREVCVFDHALAPSLRDVLLRETLSNPEIVSLVCPKGLGPRGRALILNEDADCPRTFLDSAAQICRTLNITPVVLSIARTEQQAMSREQLAKEIFTQRGLRPFFDLVACADLRSAVEVVAQCRGCTQVVVERRRAAPWWRWLKGEPSRRLLALSTFLTFVMFCGKQSFLEVDPASRNSTYKQTLILKSNA